MDSVAFVHPITLTSEMFRLQQRSCSSLEGLENSTRPRADIFMSSSLADLSKPLPSAPVHYKRRDRTSSVYSIDINELIDSYLGGESISSRESLESPEYDQHQHLGYIRKPPRVFHDGSFPGSESHLPSLSTPQIHTDLHDQANQDNLKYRYSSPASQSPDILDLRTHGLWDDEDTEFEKSIKKYRDTLLPTPFTPVSTKLPGLFPDVAPLRGLRAAEPLAFETDLLDGSNPTIASINLGNTIPRSSVRSSTAGTHISNQTSQESGPTIFHNRFSNGGDAIIDSNPYDQDRWLLSYNGSANSSKSNIHVTKASKPAPSPYSTRLRPTSRPISIRSSSTSDPSSRTLPKEGSITTLPRNWSPTLRPSNPAIPRVPRSERSPAIGLSEYQIVGPRAWKPDRHEDSKYSTIPFWIKRKRIRNSASKQHSLGLNDEQVQSDPRFHLSGRRNISNVSSQPGHVSSSSLPTIENMDLNRHSNPILATDYAKAPSKQAKFSPSKLNFSRLNTQQASQDKTRLMLWLRSRTPNLPIEEGRVWGKDTKDRINVLSAMESVDPYRGGFTSDPVRELSPLVPLSGRLRDDRWL